MASFISDGVEIAYELSGEGPPILLIHGFASNKEVNWRDTGWIKALVGAGRMVIAIDNRGHGASAKLYDSSAYSTAIMASDSIALLDHLGIASTDVMGYSMGARIAAWLTIEHPERIGRAIFAGLAANMVEGVAGDEAIARGLEAASIADVTEPGPRAFRTFAEQTKSDLKALAACMRSQRQKIPAADLASIQVPVLIVAGELDEMSGPVAPLAAIIPGAKGVTLTGRNHMNALGDRAYKDAVIAFLSG